MSKLIVETQYFPPAITFAYALAYGELCLEACETYQKGGFRARCHIAGANGTITLSIPLVKGKNQQQQITDTGIAYREDWVATHWQSIRSAYGRSPYFEYYADDIKNCLFQRHSKLWSLNYQLLETLIQLMQLPLKLTQTTSFEKQYLSSDGCLDLRGQVTYRQKENTSIWGLLPSYPQVFTERHGYLPDLSILDLLFCTGPEAIRYLQLPQLKNQ